MADIVLRPVEAEEIPTFVRTDSVGFGFHPEQDSIDDAHQFLERDRTIAAFDGAEMVGSAAAFSFELTVPGLATVPAAGVTWVAVLPTHRRRGVLRRMMAHQLDDVAARGEPVATLAASEATIYERFGYGTATFAQTVRIDRARARLREPVGAHVRLLLDVDEAKAALPPIFDQARRHRPGDHQRSESFWAWWFQDKERWRNGASARFYAVLGDEGYTAYRTKNGWDDHGVPNGTLIVEDVVATTSQAYAALWEYLLGVDLVATIEAEARPMDDPLPLLLTDRRAVRTVGVFDDLWVRVLDVPAALAARRYGADGRVVVEVHDELRTQTAGRYAVEGGPDGAACGRTTESPDLVLDVAALGSLYLGGVSAVALHCAGRVEECRPGAVARAAAMFRSDPLPFNHTHF